LQLRLDHRLTQAAVDDLTIRRRFVPVRQVSNRLTFRRVEARAAEEFTESGTFITSRESGGKIATTQSIWIGHYTLSKLDRQHFT
jgi:hypothetical protein